MHATTDRAIPVPVHRAQLDFVRSNKSYRGFVGGRGAGKSFVGAYDLLKRAKADRLYMAVSPTYSAVKDITFPAFKAIADRLGRPFKIRESDFRGWFTTQDGGRARLVFRSAENPESLRGPNLSGVWIDEASLTVPAAFDIVIACLREGGEHGWLTATFTPKGKSHWTYRQFGIESHDTFLARAKMRDNPFLSPEFVAAMVAKYGVSSLAAQELEGDFVDFEGQLIKYDCILSCQANCLWPHGVPPEESKPELYIGVDVGRSRDRTVIWTWEKVGDVCFAREIKVLHRTPFPQQEAEIRRRLTKHVVKCQIDEGGISKPMAEDLERRYPGVVHGVTLTSGTQIKFAERLRVGFETQRLRIPDDEALREDIQLVTLSNKGTVETGQSSTIGHADRFWAAALGYDAAHWSRPQPRADLPGVYVPGGRR